MSNELIGNQNNCLDAKSAYEDIQRRYNLIVKYFNERYEIGAFYFMDYEHKKFICNKFLDVLNSTSRIIYQRLPRLGMNEYRNYDFYLGNVDSENLWHGRGVYSWEWERDADGDTIIVYFVGEFCHGELTRNGVWCIFSSDDGKQRLEIEDVISVGALGDPSRYCYYAGNRNIRRSPQYLQQRRIAEQKRLEQLRIQKEQEEQNRLEWEKKKKEREYWDRIKAEEDRKKREKWEAERMAKRIEARNYSNKNFVGLKLLTYIAPITVLVVTYMMFMSPISIINKWSIMPWWGCILYILGIPIGIIVAAVLGGMIPVLFREYFKHEYWADLVESVIAIPLITWAVYAMIDLIPASVACHGLYMAILIIVSIICLVACVLPGLLTDLIMIGAPDYSETIDSMDIICYADGMGNPKIGKTALVSLAFQSIIIGGSILIFMIL